MQNANILKIKFAITDLRNARDQLVDAGAPRAAAKVRRALKSAEGALRHVQTKRFDYRRAS